MTIDSAEKLRSALERRREKATTTGLQRIPFMLDTALADRVEDLARVYNQLQGRIDHLEEQSTEEPEEGGDVRASGHDLSEAGAALESNRAELERVKAELEEAIAEAKADQVMLVFRRATADEYERILTQCGGAAVDGDETLEAAYRFQGALVERCFLRLEVEGEDSGVKSWAEFVQSAELTFGELDPIRALVFANNKRGGNSVRF